MTDKHLDITLSSLTSPVLLLTSADPTLKPLRLLTGLLLPHYMEEHKKRKHFYGMNNFIHILVHWVRFDFLGCIKEGPPPKKKKKPAWDVSGTVVNWLKVIWTVLAVIHILTQIALKPLLPCQILENENLAHTYVFGNSTIFLIWSRIQIKERALQA